MKPCLAQGIYTKSSLKIIQKQKSTIQWQHSIKKIIMKQCIIWVKFIIITYKNINRQKNTLK